VAQRPLDGVSIRSTFGDAAAPEVHTVQHYEMLGCRALYQEGWKAVAYQEIQVDDPRLDEAVWELYDLRADPSECHDQARAEPERLAAMIERWWQEAERHQVLPLDNRPFSELVFQRTPSVAPRARYTYWPGRAPVPESVAANVRSRAHDITAHITMPDDLEVLEGVLAVQGSVLGGWSFHLLGDGRLCYVHNLAGWREYRVEADIGRLAPGDHTLAFRFRPPDAELTVDGEVVGTGEVKRTAWSRLSLTGAGLTAGWSPDFSPADRDYRGRFAFTGVLHRVDIDVDGLPVVDPEREAEDILAAQ
jgi:arylsulfatase